MTNKLIFLVLKKWPALAQYAYMSGRYKRLVDKRDNGTMELLDKLGIKKDPNKVFHKSCAQVAVDKEKKDIGTGEGKGVEM